MSIYSHIRENMHEIGWAITWERGRSPEQIEQMIQDVIRDAEHTLRDGTVFEVRGKIPSDYGRDCGVAWYHTDEIQELPLVALKRYEDAEYKPLGGFMFLARLVVGAR